MQAWGSLPSYPGQDRATIFAAGDTPQHESFHLHHLAFGMFGMKDSALWQGFKIMLLFEEHHPAGIFVHSQKLEHLLVL